MHTVQKPNYFCARFFKQQGLAWLMFLTALSRIYIWLLHAVTQAVLPSFGWERERDRVDGSNMKHLPPDRFLNQIAHNNSFKLWLLKELFHPNTWPITKWPFITLTLPLESCQCLSKYSATVLSVSSQDTLSSVSTLPWLCLPQKYTNAAGRRLY